MQEAFLLFVGYASLYALGRWHIGFYLATLVAILQDPVRKLVDGQPPYFIVLAGLVFGAALIGALFSRVPLSPILISDWRRHIHTPFMLLVVIVMVQALHSLARFGSPLISLLGVINYLAPFVALTLAHAFAATGGIDRIHSFFRFYLICSIPALTTVLLQMAGWDWPIFGEVGDGIKIYDLGTVLAAYSGTFRASEIAAWHAATSACVVVLLMTTHKVTFSRTSTALLIALALLAIGILTGRRKLLVVFVLFGASYAWLLAIYWRRARSAAIPAAFIGIVAYLVFAFGFDSDPVRYETIEYSLYFQRTSGVFADVPDRLVHLGIAPIAWAYHTFGLWGGGVGVGTQGAQHLAEVSQHIAAAEGGLGKIMLELGLPGLLIMASLAVAFARHIWRLLATVSQYSESATRLTCGLTALLIANGASFSIATQTYGDIFVLLFLGICLGALLAMPSIAVTQPRRTATRHRVSRSREHVPPHYAIS